MNSRNSAKVRTRRDRLPVDGKDAFLFKRCNRRKRETTTEMQPGEQSETQLHELARHLSRQRTAILTRWRRITQSDLQLETPSELSRSQLYDHIPDILDAFEKQLTAHDLADKLLASAERRESGAGHGLHRWQQGYQLREVMREWRHLHLCLLEELEQFASGHSELVPEVMVTARRALAILCGDGVSESSTQYATMQQAEAASRVRDLQHALKQLSDLERLRGEALREAAHDLRGNVGVVKNATAVLNHSGASEEMRADCATVLKSSVESLHEMLEDLMSLARLEAGHEFREIGDFDAAELITQLCATLQPLAQTRSLFLKAEGPPRLPVKGDAVKTRRIIQNLVLNALKYTERGGVIVSWDEDRTCGMDRWMLCVQDTGPGFAKSTVTPFARVLKRATEESHTSDEKTEQAYPSSARIEPAPTLPAFSNQLPSEPPLGEGIGLLIVKRLCDLLVATLELETEIGRGTTFRVILPKHYDA